MKVMNVKIAKPLEGAERNAEVIPAALKTVQVLGVFGTGDDVYLTLAVDDEQIAALLLSARQQVALDDISVVVMDAEELATARASDRVRSGHVIVPNRPKAGA